MDDQTQQAAQPQTAPMQPAEEQELAKVLEGVQQEANSAPESGLQFGDTVAAPAGPVDMPASADPSVPPLPQPDQPPVLEEQEPEVVATESPAEQPMVTSTAPDSSNLDSIKTSALEELRPLVDKLDVSPEEKFDTYLLLLRSSDDKDLVGPAYAVAQSIQDEEKKAQALLEIIKEIDYLSKK